MNTSNESSIEKTNPSKKKSTQYTKLSSHHTTPGQLSTLEYPDGAENELLQWVMKTREQLSDYGNKKSGWLSSHTRDREACDAGFLMETDCALARVQAFESACQRHNDSFPGYLGRFHRQDTSAQWTDKRLYYRSLTIALSRCRRSLLQPVSGDAPTSGEKEKAFEQLTRLMREGIVLGTGIASSPTNPTKLSHSSIWAIYRRLPAEIAALHPVNNQIDTPKWLQSWLLDASSLLTLVSTQTDGKIDTAQRAEQRTHTLSANNELHHQTRLCLQINTCPVNEQGALLQAYAEIDTLFATLKTQQRGAYQQLACWGSTLEIANDARLNEATSTLKTIKDKQATLQQTLNTVQQTLVTYNPSKAATNESKEQENHQPDTQIPTDEPTEPTETPLERITNQYQQCVAYQKMLRTDYPPNLYYFSKDNLVTLLYQQQELMTELSKLHSLLEEYEGNDDTLEILANGLESIEKKQADYAVFYNTQQEVIILRSSAEIKRDCALFGIECTEEASITRPLLKQRYRKLMVEYHSDRHQDGQVPDYATFSMPLYQTQLPDNEFIMTQEETQQLFNHSVFEDKEAAYVWIGQRLYYLIKAFGFIEEVNDNDRSESALQTRHETVYWNTCFRALKPIYLRLLGPTPEHVIHAYDWSPEPTQEEQGDISAMAADFLLSMAKTSRQMWVQLEAARQIIKQSIEDDRAWYQAQYKELEDVYTAMMLGLDINSRLNEESYAKIRGMFDEMGQETAKVSALFRKDFDEIRAQQKLTENKLTSTEAKQKLTEDKLTSTEAKQKLTEDKLTSTEAKQKLTEDKLTSTEIKMQLMFERLEQLEQERQKQANSTPSVAESKNGSNLLVEKEDKPRPVSPLSMFPQAKEEDVAYELIKLAGALPSLSHIQQHLLKKSHGIILCEDTLYYVRQDHARDADIIPVHHEELNDEVNRFKGHYAELPAGHARAAKSHEVNQFVILMNQLQGNELWQQNLTKEEATI